MDMSNKSLALLLVAAIVISLGGTLISLNSLNQQGLTGLASGQVQISVASNMSCVVDSNVSFGSSGIVSSQTTISTQSANAGNNYTDCSSAASACAGMMVNNTGNVNINITFNSSVNGATLLGGATSDFQYQALNGTTTGTSTEPGCRGVMSTAWADVPTTVTTICTNLTANDTNDMITIEYNITIYPMTPTGTKTATITVNCAQN